MSRYIDADKLSKQIEELYLDGDSASNHFCINNEDTLIGKFQVLDLIFDQPTADVEEVRHAMWVEVEGEGYGVCSECGNSNLIGHLSTEFDYCPYCGAKMDKEKEE